MPLFLRQIPVGARFKLCRTGQKYQRIAREGQPISSIPVIKEQTGEKMTLHHSCHVKRILP